MFIAHGEKFRKHARWILGGILLLLIPGFIALFTTTGGGQGQRDESPLPKLGGKTVNAAEFQQSLAVVRRQMVLMGGKQPAPSEQLEYQMRQDALIRMILLRKAAEFGVRVSDGDLAEQIRRQPMFSDQNGQFNPDRYRQNMIFLANKNISEEMFEGILRDQITIARLQGIVGTAAKVTPAELEQTYATYREKIAVDLVEFVSTNFAGTITLTNGEVQAFFEQNRESFRLPAQTKVRYARFALVEAKKSVEIKDEELKEFYERNQSRYMDTNNVPQTLETVKDQIRDEVLALRADRLAADRATEFSVKLVPEEGKPQPDFAKLAVEAGAEVKETGFFSLGEEVAGVDAGAQFSQMAFALHPKDNPVSDPVTGKDGYYVLEYMDASPSRVPTFEEVKDKVTRELTQQREYDAAVRQGRETLEKVKAAVTAGKAFAESCKELNLRVESPEPFSRGDEKSTLPSAARIYQTTLSMTTNAVSDLIATANGALFFQLKQRLPPDPKDFERDKEVFSQRLLEQKRQAIFQNWLNDVLRQEKADFGPAPKRPQPSQPPVEPEPAPVTTNAHAAS